MYIRNLALLAVMATCSLSACSTTKVIPPAPIVAAVNEGDAAQAASLVKTSKPDDINSAMNRAAELGNVNVVKALVASGADINGGIRSDGHKTPVVSDTDLSLWIIRGMFGISDIDIPIVTAARAGKLGVVRWLVEHGADVNLQEPAYVLDDFRTNAGQSVFRVVYADNVGVDALTLAVIKKNRSMMRYLVAHGANTSRSIVVSSAHLDQVAAFSCESHLASSCIIVATGQGMEHIPPKEFFVDSRGFVHTSLEVSRERSLSVEQLIASMRAAPSVNRVAKPH